MNPQTLAVGDPERRDFFDRIADGWDARVATPEFLRRLDDAIGALGVGPDERVVDLGCGTGNLTAALLARLSPRGRVAAADYAPAMLELARAKLDDTRVEWLLADAAALPLPDAWADRVVCFSAWPHFADAGAAAAEVRRVLRPGGTMHVLHVASRHRINHIHAHASGPIAHDLLPPVETLAALFERHGLRVVEATDGDDLYHLAAVRPAAGA